MKVGRKGSRAESVSTIQQVLSVPFGKMIESFAGAIQSAQTALDVNSLRTMEVMADRNQGFEVKRGHKLSMLELGLMPSFYHFAQGTLEIRLSMSFRRSSGSLAGAEIKKTGAAGVLPDTSSVGAAAVDPALAGKYSYPPGDSCLVKSRLVSSPVPPTLSEKLSQLRRKR